MCIDNFLTQAGIPSHRRDKLKEQLEQMLHNERVRARQEIKEGDYCESDGFCNPICRVIKVNGELSSVLIIEDSEIRLHNTKGLLKLQNSEVEKAFDNDIQNWQSNIEESLDALERQKARKANLEKELALFRESNKDK